MAYKLYPGKSLQSRIDRNPPAPPRSRYMQRKVPRVFGPIADTKRAFTRFGIVEMPSYLDPSLITVDDLLRPTNRHLKLVPSEDLTEDVRKFIANVTFESVPELHPKPDLTAAQVCLLQIVEELEAHGDFDGETVARHYSLINPGHLEVQFKPVVESVVRRGLLTAEGPRLTAQGKARARAQEALEAARERLGLTEYPLVRLEPHGTNPDYDEVYLLREERLFCYFRFECFEVRVRAKIVVLSS